MSLEAFQVALAQLVSDPELVAAFRRGSGDPSFSARLGELDQLERHRLSTMAHDPRMDVLCSLYRSNRLTALVRTVPELVEALGDELGPIVSSFWREVPRHDLQFRSEAAEFCRFVAGTTTDPAILGIAISCEAALDARYGL